MAISADTLCYFGALERVLSGAAAALRPGGRLVFTVEQAEDGELEHVVTLRHGCLSSEYRSDKSEQHINSIYRRQVDESP